MPTTILSRVFQKDYKRMKLPDSDEEASEDDNLDEISEEKIARLETQVKAQEEQLKPVKGLDGIYYKVHKFSFFFFFF